MKKYTIIKYQNPRIHECTCGIKWYGLLKFCPECNKEY